jgi:hypothetical protein
MRLSLQDRRPAAGVPGIKGAKTAMFTVSDGSWNAFELCYGGVGNEN